MWFQHLENMILVLEFLNLSIAIPNEQLDCIHCYFVFGYQ